jgi:enoyl-CoA hydratase/3-hydroxyacyl-CoA dehydrogenase
MIVGVIGSGSVGPDLAYGFLSVVGEGGKVYLVDTKQEALDAGVNRIKGYIAKGVAAGRLSPKAAKAAEAALTPTTQLKDLAACDYVLESATENLETKRAILKELEEIARPDCLIGFATSGIRRAQIVAKAKVPKRCFANHPFAPAWRTLPIEVVLSGDRAFEVRMLDTLRRLGKVPIITTDVPCFAAGDIFSNYCSEAVRIIEEGLASPAQVDQIVSDAIGGGGPFKSMDSNRSNLMVARCQALMREGATGTDWFAPPARLSSQGNTPWYDPKSPAHQSRDAALAGKVLDRILAVLVARTYFVVDNGICDPSELNWLTSTALGFRKGLLDVAEDLGADRVYELCSRYAAAHADFKIPDSILQRKLRFFYRNILLAQDGPVAIVTIRRPEVRNALNERTMDELEAVFARLAADERVKGVVLTGYGGALAGADINELAALKTPEDNEAKSRRGQSVLDKVAALNKPVVAAIDGPVLGGGAELAMACHARVVGKSLMLGQPEVNLGIIPGYGGTQRLPRIIGLEHGLELLRTGRAINASQAREWGWADAGPADDILAAAKDLVHQHLAGKVKLAPVSPNPIAVPEELPRVDIGHHSLAIDAILGAVVRDGLTKPLPDGLKVEAAGFARCKKTVDCDIGLKNFIQNGPRAPAAFVHE